MRASLDDARAVLRSRFGHADLREGQRRAIAAVLAGRDVLAVMPTGGGKSICYQLPALLLDGLTVVLSPLVSLMKDQVESLNTRGIAAAALNSSMSPGALADVLGAVARGELRLLFAAPERFGAGVAARVVARRSVSLLAVDEAHCISEWGHEFRPSYRNVLRVRSAFGNPPTIALTATATPAVRRDIAAVVGLRDPEVIVTGFDRANLGYAVRRFRSRIDKERELLALVRVRRGPAVVFASTRATVERLAWALTRRGERAIAYHAGMASDVRRSAQDLFMRGGVDLIVATNAFGMGVDKPDVRLVVHHAMPASLESYYQEAGRAGRDGKASECVLLHAPEDRRTLEFFIDSASPPRPVVERVYAAMRAEAGSRPSSDARMLVSAAGSGASTQQVDAALRLLERAGAVHAPAAPGSQAWVRILARRARIDSELERHSLEASLLAELCAQGGDALEQGTDVDLAALPPGFGAPPAVAKLLDALQRRQFLVWRSAARGWRCADARRSLADWPVGWAGLDRRRSTSRGRLDAMEAYVFTRRCRRAHVLEYFGEQAPRSCAHCDNCAPAQRVNLRQ